MAWRDTELDLIDRLLGALDDPSSIVTPGTTPLDTARYTDPDALERERAALFRGRPHPVAHVSEIAEPGRFITETLAGVPLIVARDTEGAIRVHVNACRHRGAPLTDAESGRVKAWTCPYHAWSYRLDGGLLHVPDRACFAEGSLDDIALVEVPHTVRHGLIWVQLDGDGPPDVASALGPVIDADFAGLAFADSTVQRRVVHHRAANWKLVMDAFTEGYHLKSLHRTSIARFFLSAALCDDLTPHVRQCGARKSIAKLPAEPRETWDFHAHTTLFYAIFPATIVVLHPGWISLLTLRPEAIDRVRIVHRAIVRPDGLDGRFERSFELIDGQVFQNEDFAIAEQIQLTLSAGLLSTMRLGGLEQGMQIFHAARDAALARA